MVLTQTHFYLIMGLKGIKDKKMENNIMRIFFDNNYCNLIISLNLIGAGIFLGIFLLVFIGIKIRKWNKFKKVIPVEFSFSFGGGSMKYQIIRNYSNLVIANKIYIELITRKAAIKIDENHDVISEIYDSWYSLFQITRLELKNIPGELLIKNSSSNQLIKLVTDILNEGLRPHLTKYQARYRKWYHHEIEMEENKEFSPQEIQKKYPDYTELIQSMKEVNSLLIDYSSQLKKFIEC